MVANVACITYRVLRYEIATANCKLLMLESASHTVSCMNHRVGSGGGADLLTPGLARRVSVLVSVMGASVGRALKMRTWQQLLLSVGFVSACTMGMTYKS